MVDLPEADKCLIASGELDVRPARNALKPVGGKFSQLIYRLMNPPTQPNMHGRRVFDVHQFLFLDLAGGGAEP